MINTSIKRFRFGDVELDLYIDPDVFEPNLTTRMLAEVMVIEPGQRVLDLGCGIGPIALIAAMKGASEVVAVDIMEAACRLTHRNAELNGLSDRIRVVHGDLFEGLDGEKFDVIINDVSGMADGVSRISPWYPNAIPTGGHDGTGPTLSMLSQARAYLKEDGILYFPVLSLADYRKILDHAKQLFNDRIESVAHKWVPFCDEFKERFAEMEAMKEEGVIDYIQRRSRYLWSLEIYRICCP